MNVRVMQSDVGQVESDLLIIGRFQGDTGLEGQIGALDRALGGLIGEIIAGGDFQAKASETLPIYTRGAIRTPRLMLVGLGKKEQLTADVLRNAAAVAARRARDLGVRRLAIVANSADARTSAQALVEGTLLGLYEFGEYRTTTDERRPGIESLTLIEGQGDRLQLVQDGARDGEATARGVNLARDLVNRPAREATPTHLATQAEAIAQRHGMRFEALGPKQMQTLGMGALLAVAQGSREEPRFIILEHNPAKSTEAPVVLVGKAITFDSGGLSLKGSQNLHTMKGDMAAGAAVLGAMETIGEYKLPRRVIAIVPATENMPDGGAYHPGDVLRTIIGKTIEVISTDAEGRLILADALGYAQRLAPAAVVDMATLTGAKVTALGDVAAALFANDDSLAGRIEAAATSSGERVWRLPLWEEYAELIKSTVADMKNSGGPKAGSITAALMLSRFAEGMPWAHLDIAGMGMVEEEKGYNLIGGTGYGVRLLVELVRQW